MSQPKRSVRLIQKFLSLDPLTKLIFLSLCGLSFGFLLGLALNVISNTKVYRLTLAAGNSSGESYLLSQAIKKTIEKHHRNIQIDVVQTKGTAENLEWLEKGQADLVTAQADIPAGPSARTLAILYRDLFQLVVKENSGIKQFSDLKGKRLGLQQKGGQYNSFLYIAAHYGLQPKDFIFVSNSDEEADQAFQQSYTQAVFRVRAPGNESIADLVQKHQGRLVAIDQAQAMQLKHPAFQPAQIPQGAYQGSPAVPSQNLNTIAVDRLLLANQDVPEQVARKIVATLNERQQEIADQLTIASIKPLVANIQDPRQANGLDVPIHLGALNYYERNDPSFVQENADFLGLLLTLVLLGGSWVWELKNWVERGKKDFADLYIERAVGLMQEGKSPEVRQQDLDQVFQEVASNLVGEKISQESFRTFNEAYKTARESIEREKQRILNSQREVSAHYIKGLIHLMQDEQSSKQILQRNLDKYLAKASADLANDRISQESFRTFVEAYKTIRDVIDRRPA